MRQLCKYLITLPLLMAPVLAGQIQPASAAAMTPADGLTLLAHSKAVDQKCQFLSRPEREELSSYVARAEIAAAERMSVATAQTALANGKSAGMGAQCDGRSAAQVRATLAAARAAIASVDAVREGPDEPPAAKPVSKPKASAAADTPPHEPLRRAAAPAAAQKTDLLRRYGAEAAAYYADRRCRTLSIAQARSFHQGIVQRHRAALGNHGKPAVEAVLQSAEAQAAGWPCGRRTASRIAGGFASVRR